MRKLMLAVVMLMSVCGCDIAAITDIGGGRLVHIDIYGDTEVAVGDTIRLRATGQVDGLIGLLSYDPLRDARWSSSDTVIAKVSRPPPSANDTLVSSILVVGARPGQVAITASARGVTGRRMLMISRVITRPSMVAGR